MTVGTVEQAPQVIPAEPAPLVGKSGWATAEVHVAAIITALVSLLGALVGTYDNADLPTFIRFATPSEAIILAALAASRTYTKTTFLKALQADRAEWYKAVTSNPLGAVTQLEGVVSQIEPVLPAAAEARLQTLEGQVAKLNRTPVGALLRGASATTTGGTPPAGG